MTTATDKRALFASYNAHKCVGTDGRFSPARIADVIAEIGADVIALQEVDRRFNDRAGLLDLDAIARDTGLIRVPVAGLREDSHGWHGNMILAREAIVQDLRQVSLPGLEPRGAIVTDLEIRHGAVRLVAAHLGLLRRSRRRQIASILDHADGGPEKPVVMMGDFNEWRHCRTTLALPAEFGEVMPGAASFPSRFPVLALDRILSRPHHILGEVEVHDTPLARKASDHLPIKARIDLAAEAERSIVFRNTDADLIEVVLQ